MVYLLRATITEAIEGCAYKTGFTERWVRKRMSELQTGCPFPLELVGCIPGNRNQEKALHRQFSNDRMLLGGQEWFRYNPRLLEIFTR